MKGVLHRDVTVNTKIGISILLIFFSIFLIFIVFSLMDLLRGAEAMKLGRGDNVYKNEIY